MPCPGNSMNAYLIAKQVHQITAVILVALFALRGVLMLAGSGIGRRGVLAVAPHVNDTLLLLSAAYMAWVIGFQGWIVAKLLALVLYIVLAAVALKRGRTRGTRAGAFLAALAVLGYILAVSLTRRPLPL